jgi:hypothetical protein
LSTRVYFLRKDCSTPNAHILFSSKTKKIRAHITIKY